MSKILVTGGAGFIGSFLTDKLVELGYIVRILDNLEDQVHQGKTPSYLNPKAEFIHGDIRDYETVRKSLEDIEIVFQLAARVGVGQSNYEIKDYVATNIGGMANVLSAIVNSKTSKVRKILMTASMTSYGEGNYTCKTHGVIKPKLRAENDVKKNWEIMCPLCSSTLTPIPTSEETKINNNSMYSLTKKVQEEMLFLIGHSYKIPVVSLRCFNVYGPRQSLSNPYTGVTAIFISRLKNGKRPIVYEDGLQTRDFISVHDVIDALILAMESKKADFKVVNIGSGKGIRIRDIAQILAKLMNVPLDAEITKKFRKNDIRHCFADITLAQKLLSWRPKIDFDTGMKELIEWSMDENSVDMFDTAEEELKSKKLL